MLTPLTKTSKSRKHKANAYSLYPPRMRAYRLLEFFHRLDTNGPVDCPLQAGSRYALFHLRVAMNRIVIRRPYPPKKLSGKFEICTFFIFPYFNGDIENFALEHTKRYRIPLLTPFLPCLKGSPLSEQTVGLRQGRYSKADENFS